jgi:acyl carrier protein
MTDRRSNLDRLQQVVAAVLGLDPARVDDNLTHDHVDTWDSLNHINIISALEQEFGIMLPTGSMADHQSVRGLRALLGQHGIEV